MKKSVLYCLIYTIIILISTIIYIVYRPPKEIIKTTYIPIEIENEVIIEKEVVVEVEKEVIKEIEKKVEIIIEKEPEYIYDITSVEREMLARLVFREAHTEGLECQKAVVSVIINRWQNGYWGDTLNDVVYSKYQFSPASILYRTTPYEINYQAVDYVLQYGCTVPSYVLYFRANYGFSTSWTDYKEYICIGDSYFGYFTKDK